MTLRAATLVAKSKDALTHTVQDGLRERKQSGSLRLGALMYQFSQLMVINSQLLAPQTINSCSEHKLMHTLIMI